jgi:hypothetical protein
MGDFDPKLAEITDKVLYGDVIVRWCLKVTVRSFGSPFGSAQDDSGLGSGCERRLGKYLWGRRGHLMRG